ncbi:MAG: type II CRISPR-associated endonuclease Cas1 [Flavobacteriales bacterium]|nr:type II CRISPR-associated endonuclease Cas1 [Flavobacteriales bacterium]MDW8431217.1 type II CRISPR-associated endonuclease Cas1 [Flavobacteriales bacterium]
MLKRTLYFGNPAHLSVQREQLLIRREGQPEVRTPLEDIGLLVLDDPQITLTQALLARLMHHNVAVVSCDARHHPGGLMLPFDGHTTTGGTTRAQVEASQPLKKQLWKQIVQSKIRNQAALLERLRRPDPGLRRLAAATLSGDSTNTEAKAAARYWKQLFPDFLRFSRDPDGPPPNNLLNYGYAILRATVARALVCSGLWPALGLFHRNQYNAFALADDLMEPYRPFVDQVVVGIVRMHGTFLDPMTQGMKKELLGIPALDVAIGKRQSPLLLAVQSTTASLAACYAGAKRRLALPAFPETKGAVVA